MRVLEIKKKLQVGIRVSENYDVTIGADLPDDPPSILNVDSQCMLFNASRVDYVDFVDNHFIPEQEPSTDLLILVRDQTPDYGYWRIYHKDDPLCEEPHGQICDKCKTLTKKKKSGCQCQCYMCKGRLNTSGKRVNHYPLDILVEGYTIASRGRIYHRRGYECLVRVPLGSGIRLEKYSRSWEKNKHVLITHEEGRVLTYRYLNYRSFKNAEQAINL